jgi:hypothetical protein
VLLENICWSYSNPILEISTGGGPLSIGGFETLPTGVKYFFISLLWLILTDSTRPTKEFPGAEGGGDAGISKVKPPSMKYSSCSWDLIVSINKIHTKDNECNLFIKRHS